MRFLKLKQKSSLLVALLLMTGIAFAGVQSPIVMMQGVSSRMLSALHRNKSRLNRPGVINRIVNRVLIPHIDLNRMGAAVVGRQYWMRSSAGQRRQFVRQFTRLVISTYSAALASYDNDKIRFYRLRTDYTNSRFLVVNSIIIRRTGQRIPVSYNLIREGNTWKIYDFSIENISMVQSYRSQFSGTLSQSGMQGLISRLRSHNRAR